MAPSGQPTTQDLDRSIDITEYIDLDTVEIIIPNNENIDVNNPENNEIQLIVTENESQNEMDQIIEVTLEDGSTDTPTLGDFSDSLQFAQ